MGYVCRFILSRKFQKGYAQVGQIKFLFKTPVIFFREYLLIRCSLKKIYSFILKGVFNTKLPDVFRPILVNKNEL